MTKFEWQFDTPEPGIYFNMSFEDYLDIQALQSTTIKKLCMSQSEDEGALDFWVQSWMSPLKEDDDKKEPAHFLDGRAYHSRILEGKDVFYKEFASQYEIPDGMTVLTTAKHITDYLREAKVKGYSGKKVDELCMLLKDVPNAPPALHALEMAHKNFHKGKSLIKPSTLREIELASKMIEHHPHLKSWFLGGQSEVTVIWKCPITGVMFKARFDYMKIGAPIDLKTFANQFNESLDKCVGKTIGRFKYFIQGALYMTARDFAAQHVKDGKVFGAENIDPKWLELMSNTPNDEFWWVFQQKGTAPIAKAKKFKRADYSCQIGFSEIERASRLFVSCMNKYGPDVPWMDISKPEYLGEGDIPSYAFD